MWQIQVYDRGWTTVFLSKEKCHFDTRQEAESHLPTVLKTLFSQRLSGYGPRDVRIVPVVRDV